MTKLDTRAGRNRNASVPTLVNLSVETDSCFDCKPLPVLRIPCISTKMKFFEKDQKCHPDDEQRNLGVASYTYTIYIRCIDTSINLEFVDAVNWAPDLQSICIRVLRSSS